MVIIVIDIEDIHIKFINYFLKTIAVSISLPKLVCLFSKVIFKFLLYFNLSFPFFINRLIKYLIIRGKDRYCIFFTQVTALNCL